MKKRKVLFLLPVAALILSGCSLQEGLEGIKGFIGTNFYGPAKSLIQSFLGNEEQKKEEKKDEEKQDQQGGGEKQDEDQQGGGEQGGGGGGTTTSDPREKYGTTHEGTEADPLTGADAVLIGGQLEESSSSNYLPTQESYYIKGEVQELEEEFDPQFGNYSFSIEEGFVGWRLKYGPSYQAFSEGDIAIGDTVTLYAPIMNFHGTSETKGGYVTRVEKPAIDAELVGVEITGEPQTAYVEGSAYNHDGLKLIASYDNNETQDVTLQAEWSINPATATLGDTEITITASFGKMSDDLVVNVTVTQKGSAEHQGTVDDPYTPTDILSLFADLNQDETSEEGVYLQGTIAAEPAPAVSKNRGNFWVSDGASSLYVYGANGLTNQADVTLDDLPVGGSVVVSGAVKNYKGSLQLSFVDGKGQCQLISVEEPTFPVESVELSEEHIDLEVGGFKALTATVSPAKANQEVDWSISQTSTVVSYAEGKVSALAVGEATITATSVEDPTKSDSCTVTVTEATKGELLNILFAGEVEKTAYNEDEAYSAEGLKVMAHYEKGEDEDVTDTATITLSKDTATLGDTSFVVTASYPGVETIEKEVTVTVAEVNQFVEAYNAALAISSGETAQFTFKGVIAAKRQDNEWYIQHNGYGIEYYANNADFAVGKQVKVKATLQNFKGLPETKTITSAEVIGDGVMPTPVELASGADVEAANLGVLANVTGIAKADWSDYAASANKTLTLVGSDDQDIAVYFKSGLFSANEDALKAVKAGDTVTFTNVETSIFNTRQLLFVVGSDVQVTPAPAKTIASVTSVTGPEEVALNTTISTNDVTVVVEYSDGSSGNATITAVTCDTSSAGEVQADVTIEGWDQTLHFTTNVKADVVVQPYSQNFGSNNNSGYMNSSNTAYASLYDVTLNGIDWKIPGNQNLAYGLKIGGKLSAETTRSLITQTAFSNPITSVVVTTGTKDSAITVTNCAMKVYATKANAAAGTNMVEEVTASYVDAGTITFAIPTNSNWSGIYFALAFSMTSSAASQNKGMVITNITVNF